MPKGMYERKIKNKVKNKAKNKVKNKVKSKKVKTLRSVSQFDKLPPGTYHLEGDAAKHIAEAVTAKFGDINNINDILSERGQDYGDFTTQAIISQNLKEVMWNTPGWNRLQPFQKEALEMIQHKIARTLNGNPNKKDTWDDKSGYAKLAADRIK